MKRIEMYLPYDHGVQIDFQLRPDPAYDPRDSADRIIELFSNLPHELVVEVVGHENLREVRKLVAYRERMSQ